MARFFSRAFFLLAALFPLGSLAAQLPKDLKWQVQGQVPLIASQEAVKGGMMRVPLSTFPLTLRHVGPDANTVLYTSINANRLSLINFHPNTKQPLAMLAEAWAFGKEGKSVYYRLNKKARWSDGIPVTAKDFVFMLKFYRSKNIRAPWYNTYYTEQLSDIKVYDDHTIQVILPAKKPDLLYATALAPLPSHFYKNDIPKDFVTRYNWKVEPNTGPYLIDQKRVKKGRSVTWVRKKDWWAKDMPYFKNRFNVDKILFKVIRDQTVQWEHFKKGQLDFFSLRDPIYWHDKSKTAVFEKGYAHKLWFYNDRPQSCFGIWMNSSAPIFKDVRVRRAVSYATNYQKVIDTILRGEHERLESCTDGYGKYTNPAIRARPFDLAKANKLLDEAGFDKRGPDGVRVHKNGQRMEFKLMYSFDGHKDKLVPIVEEMRKAGINMVLDMKDWSASVKQTNANKHEATYSGFGAREFGVPTYWSIFHGDNANKPNTNNSGNVDDKELSKEISAYRDASEEAKRVKLSHSIQQRIHDYTVLIPATKVPFFRIGYWRWWRLPKVPATKLSDSPFALFAADRGGLFWLDEKVKEETLAAKKGGKAFEPVTVVDETYRSKKSEKASSLQKSNKG